MFDFYLPDEEKCYKINKKAHYIIYKILAMRYSWESDREMYIFQDLKKHKKSHSSHEFIVPKEMLKHYSI